MAWADGYDRVRAGAIGRDDVILRFELGKGHIQLQSTVICESDGNNFPLLIGTLTTLLGCFSAQGCHQVILNYNLV